MMSNQKPGFEFRNPEQEAECAEIAVGDPEVSCTDSQQNLPEQRTFLRMAVSQGKTSMARRRSGSSTVNA